mgnify:CR=1 FL=1
MAGTLTDVSEQTDRDTADIRPFQVSFPEADIDDMRRRIKATRWPEAEQVRDASQGVQLATMQKLARYWSTDYDWFKAQAKINGISFPPPKQ